MMTLKDLLDEKTIVELNRMSLSMKCGTGLCNECAYATDVNCSSERCQINKDVEKRLASTLDKRLEWRNNVLLKKF